MIILNRRELGNWGEKKAVKYLTKKGYQILENNFSCRIGEIDIIAVNNEFIIFVEVKLRRNNDFGPPEAAVDYRKQKKIKQIASYYLMNNDTSKKIRFDVISIQINNGKGKLKHIKNAF